VVYVLADEAGRSTARCTACSASSRSCAAPLAGQQLRAELLRAACRHRRFAVKWDGEWQITFETFRDMGIAYAAGMLLIYLLVVAQFRSYLVPLVIMAPIPLTVIGVMPGHALLGAQFTATSMIGMIALAGIIVRNSILLVDFINQVARGGHGAGRCRHRRLRGARQAHRADGASRRWAGHSSSSTTRSSTAWPFR
jgi:Cu/Ag efflux pump CusA